MSSKKPQSKPLPLALMLAISPLLLFQHVIANTNKQALEDLTLTQLSEIRVTTVSRKEESFLDATSSIQVITWDQIRRSGATSLPEALRLAGNLNVYQQSSHEWVISARGFSSDVANKLLVMIDGRTVYTPLFSGVFWDRQFVLLEDIDRIEVVSGPGGTLWGANAVNGVINIVTFKSSATQNNFAELSHGSRDNYQIHFRHGGKLDDTSFRIYGSKIRRGPEYLTNGTDGSDDNDHLQIGFRVDQHISTDSEVTISGDMYQQNTSLLDSDPSRVSGGNILTHWTKRFKKQKLSLQIYFDRTRLKLPVNELILNGNSFSPAGEFKDQLDTFDTEFQYSNEVSHRLNYIAGFTYRRTDNTIDGAPGLTFYPEHQTQNLTSAFIQADFWMLDRKIKLTAGTKFERNDYTSEEWQPNIRLAYFTEHQVLWSAISKAVRMPSRIDRDLSQPAQPNPVVLKGDENFKSENLLAYELGYRSQFFDQLIFSLTTFYHHYTDLRSTNFTEDTIIPFFFENDIYGNSSGVELNIDYFYTDNLKFKLSYNYLDFDLNIVSGGFDLNNTLNETSDPRHQISLLSDINLSDNTSLELFYRWIDKLPTNNAGTLVFVPSYSELNLSLIYMLSNDSRLQFSGFNLLHQKHQEFGIPNMRQEEAGQRLFIKFAAEF